MQACDYTLYVILNKIFINMENQLLICFTLITSGVLILIKIFLFDSKIDEIASIFAIT